MSRELSPEENSYRLMLSAYLPAVAKRKSIEFTVVVSCKIPRS